MNKDEMVFGLNSIITRHIEEFLEGEKFWKKRHDVAHKANLKLEEQNKVLTQEKQALLDVVSEWKNENHSLTALNATLSEELEGLRKDNQTPRETVQNWQRDYTQALREKDILVNEMEALSAALAAEKETVEDLQGRYEEAYKVGNQWFGEFKKITIHCEKLKTELAAAEERHEDFKKRSDEILATTEENLRKKQEQIEALTVWKTGTEKVLDSMEEKLKDYETASKVYDETIEMLVKQKGELEARLESLRKINSFQEHRIEVLSRKTNKLRKKEQNY